MRRYRLPLLLSCVAAITLQCTSATPVGGIRDFLPPPDVKGGGGGGETATIEVRVVSANPPVVADPDPAAAVEGQVVEWYSSDGPLRILWSNPPNGIRGKAPNPQWLPHPTCYPQQGYCTVTLPQQVKPGKYRYLAIVRHFGQNKESDPELIISGR